MKIKLDTAEVRQSKWNDYAIRFAFGGAVTALAGIIAKRFGGEIGGLFLAFPAILPASATLIEKLEKQKKERAGLPGGQRGRQAAGLDAVGASMGSLGLIVFALIVWLRLPHGSTLTVLAAATLAWLVVSISVWKFRETVWRKLRKNYFVSAAKGRERSSSVPPAAMAINAGKEMKMKEETDE